MGTSVFEFAIPTLADEIKLGIRERNIRRELDPDAGGDPAGLDMNTILIVRAAAIFELLLRKANVEWPYSLGPNGPAVQYKNFPAEKSTEVVNASLGFQAALMRFRGGGAGNENAEGGETVGGEQNTGQ